MQQAIDILDEMIAETIKYGISTDEKQYHHIQGRKQALIQAKSRIQALPPKVPTITIPEGTVLLGKDEYEALKEKAWRYDELNK